MEEKFLVTMNKGSKPPTSSEYQIKAVDSSYGGKIIILEKDP